MCFSPVQIYDHSYIHLQYEKIMRGMKKLLPILCIGTTELFSKKEGNPVFVLTDSNIDLLRINSYNYAHDFLLSLQSCSMLPTIDKPTRIYRDSAILIDNIFVHNLNDLQLVLSGNVSTDLSDHFS